MDSSESSLVSGDLTSTMENVLTTNEQDKNSDKNVGDSVPSSSSDANVQATVLKAVLDDPISSTSDTINSVSEMNLKNTCDVSLEISVESEGGASNASELVTDTDFFSSELNIASICTEKISEDVEDIANDLENLLGESSHEYSISSNTDRSFDLDSFESQNNKSIFEGATQTKDITTTDTLENVQLIEIPQPENQEKPDNVQLESISSDKTQVEESLFTTDGVTDVDTSEVSRDCIVFESVVEPTAGTSECANQISELESVSASISENIEYSEPDVKCTAEYEQFVIQEEIVDTKLDYKDAVAEEDQSDDEEVYGMILQIRDDNQDSTTGDEAKTEEDSQESLSQYEWSEKVEAGSSNVDLTNVNTDSADDQTCTYQTSENVSSLLKDQKESVEDKELKVEERSSEVEIVAHTCVDKQPDELATDTLNFVDETISVEQRENNEKPESDLKEFKSEDQKAKESDTLAIDSVDNFTENDQGSAELSSNITDKVIVSTEQMEEAKSTIETEDIVEQITLKLVTDEEEEEEQQLAENIADSEEITSQPVVEEEKLSEITMEPQEHITESEEIISQPVVEEEKLFEITMEPQEHIIESEEIASKPVVEEEITEITAEPQEHIAESENVTVLNHSKITPDLSIKLNEDVKVSEASNIEVTEQSIDNETKLINESEQFNMNHHSKNTVDETEDNNTENIEQVVQDNEKQEETIKKDDEKEEISLPDPEVTPTTDVIKADLQSISENLEVLSQSDIGMPTENLNLTEGMAQHSEEQIVSNEAHLILKTESPEPKQLAGLNDFQIGSSGECDAKEDVIQAIEVPVENDLLQTEAVISVNVKDEMKLDDENQKADSVTDNKTEETLVEELMKENLSEAPHNIPEVAECLTDIENCSTSAVEFAENQEHIYESDAKELVSDQENQLIVASDQEPTYASENAGDEENLEMKSGNDNAVPTIQISEPSEAEGNTDFKLSERADDSNLTSNQNESVSQTSNVAEVNEDETISLELKVLQSLEESVEAICAISKEETANKDLFEESENAESIKFRALDDIGILEVSSTIGAANELQKEPDVERFNSTQFVAEVQSVEGCIELQIDAESTKIPSSNEQVDVATIEAQDSILTDELLQKEIENLEEQSVVFPILEDNFDDPIEPHRYVVENVQDTDLTKLCDVDDQFEVDEACKYIETNDLNEDEIVTETIDLQLVEEDEKEQKEEEYENIIPTEDPTVDEDEKEQKEEEYENIILTEDPTIEEITQKGADSESTSPHVIIEEVDDQALNTNEGSGNTVCIEEIPNNEVESELTPTEPIVVMPEEQPVSEVSSSLIIESIEPESKSEEVYQESLSTSGEHKKQDSEYSSKMSSDQNLKMTITKHRIDETPKHESGNTMKSAATEPEHSILKIFDSPAPIEDKEKDTVPRLIIKPVVKPSAVISVEEVEQSVPKITIKPIVERSSSSEAQLSPKTSKASSCPESPKVTRSQKCDMLSPLKLTIKPVLKPDEIQQQKSSPKLTIKPIPKVDDSPADSSTHSPKITIKPIIKPCEDDVVHSPKITIKPVVKPPEQECELLHHSPRMTRKPAAKSLEQAYSPKKSPEREHSPRITIKPIVKPTDDQKIAKQEPKDSPESSHNPRITIKPVVKPDLGKQEASKKTEQEATLAETSHSPRITIKPIVKPVDEQKQSKQEPSAGSPKITIKPIVKPPQEIEEDSVQLIDFEEQIKQERIVLKINKTTKSTRKRQAAEATEKLAKIKVKYSRERGRAQIVSGQGKLKRALEGSFDPDFKRTRFEAGDLTITPINPIVQMEKIEEVSEPPPEQTAGATVVGIDDPLEKIPIFEITPESAAVMKTPLVAAQPLPPAPRKRGRPRKVPLVVREEFNDAVKEEKVEPPPTPPVEETGRPKRSCRGPSVRTTLGIRTRRPRGSSRGRGRGRGSRGGGTRGGRQQRISAAKLKLLKEEAASAIAEETKRLDTEHKDVEMKEEVPENVDAGTNSELVIIEEETRMSADINSSRAQTPAKQILTPAPGDVEDTQSSVQSTATTESVKVRKGTRLEVHQEPEGEVISAEQLAEYYWGGGGPFMLQEQVAQFLGIKSFKRKYPGINRRPVDMQERDFIRESGLASEAMCDLGLTAVNSADILDIMYSDFQHKYEEYCKHQRDRQAKDFSNKQKALSLAASQEKNKQDIMQQAVQSAASWNASFNKARKDERKSCMDLQTFTVHYPKGKMKKIDQPKVGFYPVALVPGQYTDYYKTFTPTELNNLPLNTMLYEPININDEDSHSDGSGSESDSSSSSSGSSSSDSSGEDNCNVCSPASSTNKKAISTTN